MATAGSDDLSVLMGGASAGDCSWEGEKNRPLLPQSAHVMQLLKGYLLDRARDLEAHGVASSRICLDPGVGFGKSPEDNIVILRATQELASLGYPLMCAVSRKRFVGTVSGVANAASRDDATIGVTLAAVARGARVLRVHNVTGMAQALDGFWVSAEPWSCTATITLFPDNGVNGEQVTAAIDAMPLSRVRVSREVEKKLQVEVETSLGRIPFQHALEAAIKGIAKQASSPSFT